MQFPAALHGSRIICIACLNFRLHSRIRKLTPLMSLADAGGLCEIQQLQMASRFNPAGKGLE